MKKQIILFSFLAGLSIQTYGQVSESGNKQDLLEKSRKQRITGFILLGGGTLALLIGGIIAFDEGSTDALNCISTFNCPADSGSGTGEVLAIAGGLAMVGSVPFFISSGSNKQKAAQLSLNTKPIYLPKNTHSGPRSYPALQLTIPLN